MSNFQVLYERCYVDRESGKVEEVLLIHVCLHSRRYLKHEARGHTITSRELM